MPPDPGKTKTKALLSKKAQDAADADYKALQLKKRPPAKKTSTQKTIGESLNSLSLITKNVAKKQASVLGSILDKIEKNPSLINHLSPNTTVGEVEAKINKDPLSKSSNALEAEALGYSSAHEMDEEEDATAAPEPKQKHPLPPNDSKETTTTTTTPPEGIKPSEASSAEENKHNTTETTTETTTVESKQPQPSNKPFPIFQKPAASKAPYPSLFNHHIPPKNPYAADENHAAPHVAAYYNPTGQPAGSEVKEEEEEVGGWGFASTPQKFSKIGYVCFRETYNLKSTIVESEGFFFRLDLDSIDFPHPKPLTPVHFTTSFIEAPRFGKSKMATFTGTFKKVYIDGQGPLH